MYSTTYDQITADFQCSRDMATLGLSLFILAQGLGPPLIAPMSEVTILYITSFIFQTSQLILNTARYMAGGLSSGFRLSLSLFS